MTRRSQSEVILHTISGLIDLVVDFNELRTRLFQKVHEIFSQHEDKAKYSQLWQKAKRDGTPAMYRLFFFQGEFQYKDNAVMIDAKTGLPLFNAKHASHPWWYDRQRLELTSARSKNAPCGAHALHTNKI